MTNFEIIQTIANIATSFSFIVVAWQLWESNKQTKNSAIQKRSEYIIDLYNTFVNDEDMMKIYYELEYSEFNYDASFHGSETEKQLDKLLGHFSNVGRLYNLGILTREDLNFLEYEFLVIYQNKNIQAYLAFLDNWFKRRKINDQKFQYFRLTAQTLEKDNKNS
jgi:hypothetical protein